MQPSTKQGTKWALVALIFATLFIFRVEYVLVREEGETLRSFVGTAAMVAGEVVEDPDERASTLRVVVKVKEINGRDADGTLLAVLSKEAPLAYGDVVEVYGVLQEPENFKTDSGREFDYKTYLRVRGISATMPFAQLRAHQGGPPSILRALFVLKQSFGNALERTLPEPQGALLQGILLGERGGFPQELLQLFVVVGLIHIVVLSGSNISIVAEGIFRALGFLPRTLTFVVGGATVVLFVLMTGSGAAALRAMLMAGLALLARYLRRPELALRGLGVAGAALLLYNPLFVLDSGFVLSFLATFGLITIAPYVEGKLSCVPDWSHFNLRSIVASTIAVGVFLLPALLFHSGVFSLVSVPVNVIVLPFVWLVMLVGFITAVAGLVHPALALVPALIASALLSALLWVTHMAAALPFAHASVSTFPTWVAVAVYIPLTFIAWMLYRSVLRQQTSLDF